MFSVNTNEKHEKIVLEMHDKLNHGKNIFSQLKKNEIEISKNKMLKILDRWEICATNIKNYHKPGKYVLIKEPGEILDVDLLEIKKIGE